MFAKLSTADLTVFLVYMAGVVAIGCRFAKTSSSTQNFIAAGGALPGWVVGMSMLGTYVSSIGFLGNSGKAFGESWSSWVFALSLPISGFLAVKFFVPFYRNSGYLSAYSHFEDRFGHWARLYTLICYLLSQLARVGTILYLVALALAPLTGWDIKTLVVVTGILVTIYTLIGGISAVIWTDVIQTIVLTAGALFCIGLLFTSIPGGPSQLIDLANANGKFDFGSLRLDLESLTMPQPSFWIVLVYGVFINLMNFGIDQNFVQRYFTAKSTREASFSVWLSALLFPVVSAIFFFIGTGIYSYAQSDPEFLQGLRTSVAEGVLMQEGAEASPSAVEAKASELTTADLGDKALPYFIAHRLPAGIAGLLIAAIFAAAMSSMDTSLNSSATVFYVDVYKGAFRPNASERESMNVLRVATFALGVIGTVTALAMLRIKSALDAWWTLQGVFTGGMLGLFLLGLICRRARNAHAIAAILVGILTIVWLSLSTTHFWPESWSSMKNPFHPFLTIVIGTSVIVITGCLGASISNRRGARPKDAV